MSPIGHLGNALMKEEIWSFSVFLRYLTNAGQLNDRLICLVEWGIHPPLISCGYLNIN